MARLQTYGKPSLVATLIAEVLFKELLIHTKLTIAENEA